MSRKTFDPNSTEPFNLSRTGVEDFVRCPRCFYLNIRRGISKVKSFPFTLNNAVDALLKNEFDLHRAQKTKHPLVAEYEIDAIPFSHDSLEDWRNKNDALNRLDAESNFRICGKLDDVWVNPQNELIVVDYKATSTPKQITLDEDYRKSYKRQLEIYGWILKGMGFKVHHKGYFVYANAKTSPDAFNNTLQFETIILEHTLDDSWIPGKLLDIRKCLTGNQLPLSGEDCSLCEWVAAAVNADK